MSHSNQPHGNDDENSLKEKIKHPFHELKEKLEGTHLHNLKVGLTHKKCAPPPLLCVSPLPSAASVIAPQRPVLTREPLQASDWEICKLGALDSPHMSPPAWKVEVLNTTSILQQGIAIDHQTLDSVQPPAPS